jgi:hypothetical protein
MKPEKKAGWAQVTVLTRVLTRVVVDACVGAGVEGRRAGSQTLLNADAQLGAEGRA